MADNIGWAVGLYTQQSRRFDWPVTDVLKYFVILIQQSDMNGQYFIFAKEYLDVIVSWDGVL